MSVDNLFFSVERVELLPKGKKRRAGGKGKRALLSPQRGKIFHRDFHIVEIILCADG